jgi:hypothetical protein
VPRPSYLLLLLLLVTAETLASVPLAMGVGVTGASALRNGCLWLLWLAAVGGLTAAVVERATGLQHPLNRVLLLGGGFVLAAFVGFIAARGPFNVVVLFLAALVFYWRGSVAAAEEQDHEAVQRRFGFGFALLVTGIALLIARGLIYQQAVWVPLALVGIAYTVLALASLSAARVEETREGTAGESVALAVVIELAIVLVLGVAALALFSRDVSGVLIGVLGPAWDAVANVLALIATAVLSPLFWLVEHFHIHINVFHHKGALPIRPPRPLGRGHRQGGKGTTAGAVVIPVIIVALVVLALAALLWQAVPKRARKERKRGFEEERKSLITPAQAWRFILLWFRSLFHRGTGAAGSAIQRARRRVLGPAYPDDPVRRIYAQVLYRASRQGVQRSASMTPVEFRLRLRDRWPEGDEDFAALTDAYMARRYGEVGPDQIEMHELRTRWQRLRQLMRAQPSGT